MQGGTRAYIATGEEWTKVIGPIFVYVNHLDHPKPTSQSELDTLKGTEGNPTVPASWRDNANALWADALAQAKKETSKWPYEWVRGCDYTPLAQRGTVSGRIVLDDPMAPKGSSTKLPHLTVILSHPDEPLRSLLPMQMPSGTPAKASGPGIGAHTFAPRTTGGPGSWIHDARFYQFIADGSEDGQFTIPKIRPGKYTLHA